MADLKSQQWGATAPFFLFLILILLWAGVDGGFW
ncbi:hypothetical protein Ga0451573_001895 [Peptococcaceae bacterium DYL19]|nr:hypothetical protein [Phosphitispora fastidiosa]